MPAAAPAEAPHVVPPVETGEYMPITIVGLGKMGARMGAKLVAEGHPVYGWDMNPEARDAAVGLGIWVPETLEDAILLQEPEGNDPRVVWQMLPASRTKEGLQAMTPFLSEGDVPIDGGNSRYTESDNNAKWLGDLGLRPLFIGVSGGVKAAKTGYPLMVGGDEKAYQHITPVLDTLAVPNGGHDYFGPGGAGHFVKMVHNGIEYPIMQAIGEGFGVLRASGYGFDLSRVAELFRKNTLVSGFMMDITAELLAAEDPDLSSYREGIGSASGEALWTVDEAARLGVPTESIEQAIDFRRRSTKVPAVRDSYAARVVAAQRAYFGGHTQQADYIK